VILQGAVVHGVILRVGHMIQGAVVGHPGWWTVDSSVVLGASSIHHRGVVAATSIGYLFSKGSLDQQDQNKGSEARHGGIVVWNGYLEFVSMLITRLRKDCSYLGSAVSCYHGSSKICSCYSEYILSDVIAVVSKFEIHPDFIYNTTGRENGLLFLSMWNGVLHPRLKQVLAEDSNHGIFNVLRIFSCSE